MADKLSHKERTRARILDEAARAIREYGSEGIGVATLMKRAGLTHGGFYAHFENRDDLVAHALDRMRLDSREMLARYLGERDAAEGLSALIDYYLSDQTRKLVDQGCPLPALTQEARRLPAAARDQVEGGIRNFRGQLEAAFTRLGLENPSTMAASVLSEMVGAMTLARALNDESEASDLLRSSRLELKRRLGIDELPAEH
ncbi:TetR/AcrR family transcriptional regulator [Acetobacteraceae bacterium H6797]|nr:TetR/AcrR family transcriptional regulator [Acetobacteraceae bacterium H6797]